jgi:putative ABC transport system permease protein
VLRLAWKSALGHKGRLLLMMLAIVLGVAFVTGSYVFTDTMKDAFNVVFDQGSGVDIVVRAESPFGVPGFNTASGRVPAGVLSVVEEVDGVAKASPVIQGWAQPIDKDGQPIGGIGPPNLAFAFEEDTGAMFGVELRAGRFPSNQGEVAIDVFTAQEHGFAVGGPIEVLLLSGTQEFTVVGTVGFGTADNLLGATITIFDLAEAPRALGFAGEYSEIAVTLDAGADPETVVAAISAALPPKTEAILSQVATQEGKDMVAEIVGLLNTVFLAFAGIGIFVGAFLIQNTYRIVVAQRTRELGLLRAVGATGGQVTRLVLLEALIVGLVASVVGVGAGIGLAAGLRAVFGATGMDIPQGALTVLPRTIVIGLLVGTLVTLASAILPARKAAKIPPVAALRELESTYFKSLRLRAAVGAGIVAVGVALLLAGLFAGFGSPLLLTGLGAAIVFIGVSVVAPLFARSFGRVVGSPLPRVLGVEGRLARENAVRKPRRMAATASALMIGVALVTLVATLVASMKASVGGVRTEMRAEYQVALTNQANPLASGLSPELGRRLGDMREVAAASSFRMGEWRDPATPDTPGQSSIFQPGLDFLIGVDPDFDAAVDLGVTEGSFADLSPGTAMVRDTFAQEEGLELGDALPVEFPDGTEVGLRVVAIFNADLIGTAGGINVAVSMRTFLEHYDYEFDQMVLVKLAEGVDAAAIRPALEAVVADYPNAELTTTDEYVAKQEGQLNQGLNMMYIMLAMAIIIALLGIANTLALSIMERKREIGLLRAVGMTRRQVRRMIRWEAVLIAVFGAVIGMLVGIGLGVAVVAAIGQGLVLTLPWANLAIYLVLAALGGVAASIFPGWRGARLDVLDAIAYE